MSIDQRLRTGLHRTADTVDADSIANLHRVRDRHHRDSRSRAWLRGGAAAVAVAALVAVALLLPRGLWDSPNPAPTGPTRADVVGVYIVDVADSDAAREANLVGRWVIDLTHEGEVVLEPPPGYSGITEGGYAADATSLRVDVFSDLPGCQRSGQFLGTYTWTRTDTGLSMTVQSDSCTPRVLLLTAQEWRHTP